MRVLIAQWPNEWRIRNVKIVDVLRASGEQSREIIDPVLVDLQALVDEFNEKLPFANE